MIFKNCIVPRLEEERHGLLLYCTRGIKFLLLTYTFAPLQHKLSKNKWLKKNIEINKEIANLSVVVDHNNQLVSHQDTD